MNGRHNKNTNKNSDNSDDTAQKKKPVAHCKHKKSQAETWTDTDETNLSPY